MRTNGNASTNDCDVVGQREHFHPTVTILILESIQAEMMGCPSLCGWRKDALFVYRRTGSGFL